ncbi:hypothetical protein HanPI659440_Chr13g0513441 [Helianthus annuus]|nr:hypothetical protein HanPI659440_Chr13g0513441 [Helianthus annuus]
MKNIARFLLLLILKPWWAEPPTIDLILGTTIHPYNRYISGSMGPRRYPVLYGICDCPLYDNDLPNMGPRELYRSLILSSQQLINARCYSISNATSAMVTHASATSRPTIRLEKTWALKFDHYRRPKRNKASFNKKFCS